MKLRKAIKKIIALGTGATMVGATMLSALAAADLSTYPEPFVQDGVFNALIVVGESAATQDVLGAIDIATSLQYASKTTTTVGTGTGATISQAGDSKKIEKSSNKLEFNEQVSSIQASVTKTDLDALATGTITNEYGDFDYEQTIYLPISGTMLFTVDPDDEGSLADTYFVLANANRAYSYKVTFTPALKSDHSTASPGNFLEDIRNKKMTLLGEEYTILTADHPDKNQTKLVFMGGAVSDILEEGTSKTYTVEAVDYDVSLDYVSSTEAKFTVNGEVSDTLSEGGTYKLADGTELGVIDIMENEAGEASGGDRVEFHLGANKIQIEDTQCATNQYTAGTVTIGSEDLSSVKGDVVFSSDGGKTHGSDVYISSIYINYTPSQDIYMKAGDSAADKVDIAEAQEGNFFADGFDYTFEGLQVGDTETVKLYPSGSNNYKLKWKNKNGVEYSTDIFGRNAAGDYRLGRYTGSAMRDLVNNESEKITDEEYFIVSANKYSHIMQFKDIVSGSSTTDYTGTVKVKDLGTGDIIEVTYSGTANSMSGSLSLDGNSFLVKPDEDKSSANITVDMDGDGANAATLWNPELWTEYGLNITLYDSDMVVSTVNGSIKFTTEQDEDSSQDVIQINFTESGDSKIDIEDYTAVDMTQSGAYTGTMQQAEDGSYLYKWYTNWGMLIELDQIGSGNTQNELTLTYPDEEAFGAFFVNSGPTTTTTSTGTGAVETTSVTKIDVGAAVLDTDPAVSGHETEKNLIVVGGPAINKAAAVLLGLPFPSYGSASTIPENAALIKLVEQTDGTVAVIVAGWTAEDSQRASRVLADYATYQEAGTLTGAEVQVSGTSLTDITVSAPAPVEEEEVEELEEEVVEEEA